MTINKRALSILIVAGLASATLPAIAATSHWHVARVHSVGTSAVTLPYYSNHFCFLSKVKVEETAKLHESASCEVHKNGLRWVLQARLGDTGYSKVSCAAYCFNR